MLDCLIIGAGPAGLSAATYLARYRRDIACVDAGASRAESIPLTHNLAGYPDGIPGKDLLARLREQAQRYGVQPERARVEALRVIDGGFEAQAGETILRAARVILATGVVDLHPDFPGLKEATLAGAVRWCAICDGYDVIDQDLAVFGPPKLALGHALFLRTYTRKVALLAMPDRDGLDEAGIAQLEAAGIELVLEAAIQARASTGGGIEIEFAGGSSRRFDALYPMQGSTVQAALASELGAECDENGDLVVDAHQCTSVPGLYGIGDLVDAINQIGVAFGHAAIAATAVHRSLPRNLR